MPTVVVSSGAPCQTAKSKPPPSQSSLGFPHLPLSNTSFHEGRGHVVSLSPSQAKRRRATVMMEFEDEDCPLGSKRTTYARKRNKFGRSHPNGTQDETSSTTSRNDSVLQQLQEQREQLPIARGGSIHNFT
jgi:hypothetical protein